MEISSLASGSSGNCFFVRSKKTGILIDAGISCKQILLRLASLNVNPEELKAIFLTHEHSDHIRGADVLSRNLDIPIYATKGTIKSSFLEFAEKAQEIKNNETLEIGNLQIDAFSKSHNCSDPVSYSVTNSKKVSFITDLGYPCKNVIQAVEDSDCLCIESNHDIQMLENGPYPYFLKKWIKSDKGHLSNRQSALCVLEHAPRKLKQLMLAHLSETNNTPLLALSEFSDLIKERSDLHPKLSCLPRFHSTGLIKI